VIPAYNEEQGVAATIEELRQVFETLESRFEIIVVDDGSTDRTAHRAEACGVRVIRHASNLGYGASLKSGIQASESEFVLITDADGTYPAEAIPELLRQTVDADMVVGARTLMSSGVSWSRKPAKWILNRLAQYLAGQKIPDLNSGLRVFRREVLTEFLPILPQGFSFTTTVTLGMLCTNRRVKYVPIEYRKRVGSSKIRPFHFLNFLVLVLRTIVLFNPLKVFLPLGAMLLAFGVLKSVYDVFLWNLSESAVMAILAAVIVWCVGLLADMIGRLHLRPGP
jgi:glycosyltransferase involved in cell wall biosynthesis